ncbi:hypothetical protein TS85_16085 [Sphingomonas hengshuiensis]|uniref:Uncharacterized protein n=1 Tax=Sphingomonas hengshuiensis TaxID=1609977 RepID=A0A7U4JA01_9SPHN|nr:hypothetical protein TS85_16085 [Sphingomonas hengshuiensis]
MAKCGVGSGVRALKQRWGIGSSIGGGGVGLVQQRIDRCIGEHNLLADMPVGAGRRVGCGNDGAVSRGHWLIRVRADLATIWQDRLRPIEQPPAEDYK